MSNRTALLAGISVSALVALSVVAGCSDSDDPGSGSSSSGSGSSSSSTSSSGNSGTASSTSSSSTSSSSSTGGGSGGGGALSCNSTADNECVSYSSTPSNAVPADYCHILGDGYAPIGTCSQDALYATCTFTEPSSGVNEVFYWYTAGHFSESGVKAACDAQHGTLVLK